MHPPHRGHQLGLILEKKSSFQVNGANLEPLGDEGNVRGRADERTIRRVEGMHQLLHSPSEKRYKKLAS